MKQPTDEELAQLANDYYATHGGWIGIPHLTERLRKLSADNERYKGIERQRDEFMADRIKLRSALANIRDTVRHRPADLHTAQCWSVAVKEIASEALNND